MPISQTTSLTSSQTPTPIAPLPVPAISGIAIDGGSSVNAKTIATGGGASTLITAVNDHAARVDIASQVLAGVPSIITGLGISEGTGLVLNVAAGQAAIKGIMEYAGGTVTVAASGTSRIWIDLNGSVSSGTGTYTPSNPAVYLGSVTASGSAITAIDIAGVFRLSGGIPTRTVGDTFKPTTAPTAGSASHITKTAGGRWLWDGTRYNLLIDMGAITNTLSGSSTAAQIVTYLQSLGLVI